MTVILTEEEQKKMFIDECDGKLSQLTKEEIEKYKEYVKEGIEKNWIEALYAVAYGCYGGNEVFKCDWVKSRDTLLKIIEIQGDKDPFIYNTLGYIYYYGRCNDKVPQYNLAFQYYSVGAANGVYESIYKLADMFISGKGVLKSERAGAKLILSLYDENREIFRSGDTSGKFADVALRVGGLYEKGIGVERSATEAFAYYKEAEYAIELRRLEHDYYGDGKVEESIKSGIERVWAELPKDFIEDEYKSEDPNLVAYMISESVALEVELTEEYGEYFLKADFIVAEDMPNKILLNVPQLNYCEMVDSIKLKVNGIEGIDDIELPQKAFINTIVRNDEKEWIFCLRDVELLKFKCDSFLFSVKHQC